MERRYPRTSARSNMEVVILIVLDAVFLYISTDPISPSFKIIPCFM